MPRERYLRLVESERVINGRFKDVVRIDQNGGNGFFSMLFKAQDLLTGKEVALKFFDPNRSGWPDRMERFEREASMLVALKSEP